MPPAPPTGTSSSPRTPAGPTPMAPPSRCSWKPARSPSPLAAPRRPRPLSSRASRRSSSGNPSLSS
eukprot:3475967-Pyramimonas_sp.AAC.1